MEHSNAVAKIRGAWGRTLAEGASTEALAGGPCAWAAPCAYDVFFNVQGRLTARLEIPKPFVVALDRESGDLIVTMTLFGIAADWAGEAADGLVRAMRRGLDEGGRRRVLSVTDRALGVSEGLPVADLSRGAVLEFLSPVALRSGSAEHVEPAAMITSLANRVGGLARWHGVQLALDAAALKAEAAALAAEAEWSGAEALSWRQRSLAQDRSRMMVGVTGALLLPPPTPGIAALLSIGAETHIGSRAALGMGRYRLLARR